MTFRRVTHVRASQTHICPECRTSIESGTLYVRWAGTNSSSGFCRGISCTTCEELLNAYCAHKSFNDLEEVEFPIGDLIYYAADLFDLQQQPGWNERSLTARRDAALAELTASNRRDRLRRRKQRAQHHWARAMTRLVHARLGHSHAAA